MKRIVLCLCVASPALAQPVQVSITGTVEFNQINEGTLGQVQNGESASLTFMVDASQFMDSPNFPTRGYEIDQGTFELAFDSASIGLQDPYPGGMTPYFVIRNDDPAVDGFFISNSVDFPIGVELDQTGLFEQFKNNFSVTYVGETLDSLNIEDAFGTYDFDGLTVFNWTIDDGPFNAMGIVFEELTIVPAPASVAMLGAGALLLRRRR